MGKKNGKPLKYGILFGVGAFLYTFSFIFFAPDADGGDFAFVCFCYFSLTSYLFLAILSLVAIFVNRENRLTKRLMIAGSIVLTISFLFLLAPNMPLIPSFIMFYPSITLVMLGFHYLSPSPGIFSRYIGFALVIPISFLGIILFAVLYYEQTLYLFLLPGIFAVILCILSGYHSSKMLSEVDNHDKT